MGYLGWLPLSGLMPSVRKQKPRSGRTDCSAHCVRHYQRRSFGAAPPRIQPASCQNIDKTAINRLAAESRRDARSDEFPNLRKKHLAEPCSCRFEFISPEVIMKISARNMLKGKIKSITPGAVNSEITVELSGGQQIVSVITKTSADNLQLKVGKEVYAIVKSSNVMIGVD